MNETYVLKHWGRVTHICAIWRGHHVTGPNEVHWIHFIEIETFSLTALHLKTSCVKVGPILIRPQCVTEILLHLELWYACLLILTLVLCEYKEKEFYINWRIKKGWCNALWCVWYGVVSMLVHVPLLAICKAVLYWNRFHYGMFYEFPTKPYSEFVVVKITKKYQ